MRCTRIIERVRRTHWIRTTERLEEAEKLGALLDIPRLPGESLDLYRERLLAMAVARLHGATGPREIRQFVFDYVNAAEKALRATLVVGLHGTSFDDAFERSATRPAFVPLAFVENGPLRRVSPVLAARGDLVPYLLRWRETNRGLDETVIDIDLRGLFGGRTAIPVVANLTTGQLIGYRDVLRFGQRLQIRPASAAPGTRDAVATLNGRDVTSRLFSVSAFEQGVPFTLEQLDAVPQLPALARGANDWIYLQLAHFDVKGLDHAFLSMAGPALREAVFNDTAFDDALFSVGSAGLAVDGLDGNGTGRLRRARAADCRRGIDGRGAGRTIARRRGSRPRGQRAAPARGGGARGSACRSVRRASADGRTVRSAVPRLRSRAWSGRHRRRRDAGRTLR
ncbi:MAG: hypothetical protein QM736_22515 [Vicinamibacterales bacterium]